MAPAAETNPTGRSGVHVIIMGCGRVGSELAARLAARGHTIAVIDKNRNAFRNLRYGSDVQQVHGYGFDEEVLDEAGVRRAGASALTISTARILIIRDWAFSVAVI